MRAPGRQPSVRSLRRWQSGDGLEVSEAYLAHSEKTLARVYSNRDFDKLADALGIMEAELAAVFT